MMLLTELFKEIPGVVRVEGEAEIGGLCVDSRRAAKSDLYFCQPGAHFDGHDFAMAAVRKGAAAVVVTHPLDVPVPQVQVKDVRAALSLAAARFYGEPANGLRLIGVTGTKGKTTTTYLIRAILQQAGEKTGLIGTVNTIIGDQIIPGSLTTPEAIDFQRTLRMMADQGVTSVVMEVSANAVTLKRLYGTTFEVGVFTNFSQDHLDFYGTMDNYFAAKKAFFTPGFVKRALTNADDVRGCEAVENVEYQCYGVTHQRDAYATDIEMLERGVRYTLNYQGLKLPLELALPGLFNVYNSMAAAVCCLSMGVDPVHVKAGLEGMHAVPGRIELLKTQTPYRVILDYAHSPDSLVNILSAVRQFTRGRLITVFGCGGNRDTSKRPQMGKIAGEMSDFTVITSDNPRYEDPMDIIGQIKEGIEQTQGDYIIIENRTEAIRFALEMAGAGDTVVLAGKGHETYQEIKGVKHPFDERVVVAQLLETLGAGAKE